jgi:protein involved in polysaccharide export with SLBB domain
MIGCYLFASTSQGGYAGDTTITAKYECDGGAQTSFTNSVQDKGGGSYWQPFTNSEQTIINAAGECNILAISSVIDPEPVTIRPVVIRSVSATVTGTVQLSATQPYYAPAKAGDAMTLTSAYDAAKTASQLTRAQIAAIVTNRINTVSGGKITSYTIDGLGTVNVIYDVDGIPTSEVFS